MSLIPAFKTDALSGAKREQAPPAFKQYERRYRMQRLINTILRLSMKDLPLEVQLRQALDTLLAAPFLRIQPRGGVFLAESDRGQQRELKLVASKHFPAELQTICGRVPFGRCLCGRAAQTGRMLFSRAVDEKHEHLYEEMVPHGHYVVPLVSKIVKGETLGVLVLYVKPDHKADRDEERFLQTAAHALAGMIERRQAQEALARAKESSEALNRINTIINSSLDFDRIMKSVIGESSRAIGSEAAMIVLRQETMWAISYIHGMPKRYLGNKFTDDEARATVLAVRTGRPIVVDDAYEDPRINAEVVREYGMRSMLAVPLAFKETPVGALVFYYTSAARAFNEDQIDFAGKLAVALALSVENARLYARQRTIADTMQRWLLELPDRLDGIDFGFFYQSATTEADVGGDFYDLFPRKRREVGIVVGDVSGKGLDAAKLTATVKNMIYAYSLVESSPARVMALTNKAVWAFCDPSTFVTAFYGVLNPRSGSLRYACAGHPPPIIKEAGAGSRPLALGSAPLGVLRAQEYAAHTDQLRAGENLVLYTDGVIEARSKHDFFGDERLSAFLDRSAPATAGKIPAALFSEIKRFSRGRLRDDVAVLAVSPAK